MIDINTMILYIKNNYILIYWSILFILNNILFFNSPEKYSGTNTIINITYKNIYIILFTILLLNNLNNYKNLIKNYTWILILFIIYLVINRNYKLETIKENNTLNIPPNEILIKKKRILIISLTLIIFISYMFIDQKYNKKQIIVLLIYLYLAYTIIIFKPCMYNLPTSWSL